MDDKEKNPEGGGEKPPEIPPEIAANPDVEDPRLYSPMQEADRPAPEERIEQVAEPPSESDEEISTADKAE